MKPLHRNLLIILGVTAVVYGGLLWVGRPMSESSAHAVGENVAQGPRAQKLNSVEAQELLKKLIIPTVNLENVTLAEALDFVNAEIAKQVPEGQPRPKVMIDPAFLKWDRDAHESETADKSLMEALGDIDIEILSQTIDRRRIEELRLRNIPAEVLIQYICDAAAEFHYFYHGDVYLTGGCKGCSRNRFFYGEVFDRIRLDRVRVDQLVASMDAIIDAHECRGLKGSITVRMSEQARKALLDHKISLPAVSLDLKNVTINDAMGRLALESKGALHLVPDSDGYLIFDPLDELKKFSEDGTIPMSSDFWDFSEKLIAVDENWNKQVPAKQTVE